MAIWQYNVFLVPLINFDKKYLEFIKQEDSNYLKSTECFWEETFINKNEIELKIDKFITDYKSTSDNFLYWKGDTSNFYDNDSSIAFDENDNINFFNFRMSLIELFKMIGQKINKDKQYWQNKFKLAFNSFFFQNVNYNRILFYNFICYSLCLFLRGNFGI